jgi:hypothetical protein
MGGGPAHFLCQNQYITFTVEKSSSPTLWIILSLKKPLKVSNRPTRKNLPNLVTLLPLDLYLGSQVDLMDTITNLIFGRNLSFANKACMLRGIFLTFSSQFRRWQTAG